VKLEVTATAERQANPGRRMRARSDNNVLVDRSGVFELDGTFAGSGAPATGRTSPASSDHDRLQLEIDRADGTRQRVQLTFEYPNRPADAPDCE
jgi:hypothetical protein